MSKRRDLIGQRFGKLEVMSLVKNRRAKDGCSIWTCCCDCGNTVEVESCHLGRGRKSDCGCVFLNFKKTQLIRQRFGFLSVTEFAYIDTKYGQYYWKCLCDCGNTHIVSTSGLRSGDVKSCGCWSKVFPHNLKHGMKHTTEYNIYQSILARCNNVKQGSYFNYGGRGIKVLWNSFEEFYEDMGPRPEGLTIERIDNDGHYYKDNCRWATRVEQANNRRNSIFIEYNGIIKTIRGWCDELGTQYKTVYQRYYRNNNASFEELFT